jgi:hypothetical protein
LIKERRNSEELIAITSEELFVFLILAIYLFGLFYINMMIEGDSINVWMIVDNMFLIWIKKVN